MRTEIRNGITVLFADEGKIIALDGVPHGVEVWLGVGDTREATEIDPPEEEEQPNAEDENHVERQ